jgi:hypothetical protein
MERKTPANAQAHTPQPRDEGFVRRLLFDQCDKALRSGRADPIVNGRPLPESEMRDLVAYAHKHGFLS